MFMKKCLLFSAFLISASVTIAAGIDTIHYQGLNRAYIKSYCSDGKAFVLSPAKWKLKQWLGFGAVTGAGIVAYTQDEKIQAFFADHRSSTAAKFSKYAFEPFGRFSPLLAGGLYITGILAKDNRLAGTSLTAAKALVVSSVISTAVKQLTHRHRPFQDNIPIHTNWDGPLSEIRFSSFPSGHSTAAFSMATVFAMEYRHTIWVPVLAYTLATGTAVSRLYDNKHWASDVVMGSVLGFVCGRFMWKQSHKPKPAVVIIPAAGVNVSSLTLIIRLSEPSLLHDCSKSLQSQ